MKDISPHEVGSGSKPILYRQVSWHPPSNASGKDESGYADSKTTSHITSTTRSGIAPPPSNEQQQGYDMISPTHNRTSMSSTIEEMTPTSVRSIQLAQLYHSSRRSRHACQSSSSGNSSTMFSTMPIAPPPLAFPSSTPDPTLVPVFITTNANEEKIWKEMESAISNTAKEEWSFNIMSNSMSSNSLSSMEMMVDDDMTCMEDVEVGEVFDDDVL